MAFKEEVAHLSNGAQISYIDTGAPEGLTIYRTFLFFHGAAHNKCISPLQISLTDQLLSSPFSTLHPREFEGFLCLSADMSVQLH